MRRNQLTKRKKMYILLFGVALLSIGAIVYAWASLLSPHPKVIKIESVADTRSNIQYCNSKNPSLTLNLYSPKNTAQAKVPLVVYVHGGGWLRGDESGPLLNAYGPLFIARGIAVAAIDYRLDSKNPYPDQNDDIACALSYIDSNADNLHIDVQKIIYFGDSAGGQLAAFAALTIPYKKFDYTAPVGVIDFYGVSDFTTIISGTHPDLNARRYLGSKYNTVAIEASPTTYITKKAPQFLFFHGTKDAVVPISQSITFYDQLIAAGVESNYVAIQGAGHAFIGPELPASQYKKIQDNLDVFLKETINK